MKPSGPDELPISVVVIDDDAPIRESLRLFLEAKGMHVHTFAQFGAPAQAALGDGCEVVLLDVYLGAQDGGQVLNRIKEIDGQLPVIMISGQASVQEALQLTRSGAFDFLEKPLSPERLELTVRNAVALRRLRVSLRRKAVPVAVSQGMQRLLDQAERFAASGSTVLILGESGSGKDVLARFIHDLSPRAQGPYLALNCAALPRDLIEAELFGHARGAFTGASTERIGLLAAAAGGTLFLDEIAELPLEVQAKFLRFLESGEYQRLGDSRTHTVSLRILAATHQDLELRMQTGAFRRDLYYRLNVLPLYVPPLRQRMDDIPALLRHFLAPVGMTLDQIADARLIEALQTYEWPGNVRELRNTVERMTSLYRGQTLGVNDLDTILTSGIRTAPVSDSPEAAVGYTAELARLLDQARPLAEARDLLEIAYLQRQLALHGGSIAKTAEAVGLLPNNLSRRLRILGIQTGQA